MAKILDTKPSHRAEPPTSSAPSLISDEKLIAIYTVMLRCRMLQQRAAALFQQGKLDSDLHSSAGREASAAAVCVDLQPEDTLSIVSGDWLPAFVKGLPAEALFSALAPRINGHSTPPTEPERRNILVHANAIDQPAAVRDRAEALHSAKKPVAIAAFLQPGERRADQWQKVVSAAAAKKLPIVFVQPGIEDRLSRAISSRGRSKPPQALFHGVPAISVDAADPVALYRVAYEAITRARQGRGATMLQCTAVPVVDLVDLASNQPVPPPDPVSIMETYLKSKGIQPEPFHRQVVTEFTRDLDLATRFLES